MSTSSAVVEPPKSRNSGNIGVGGLALKNNTGNKKPSKVQSFRNAANKRFSWKGPNASRQHLSPALDNTASAMNRSPIEQQNTKATSSITGDTLCSQPPAQEEPAITPALATTSNPGQITPPAVVSDDIDTLNPESSGEMKASVRLRYKSPEFQDLVIESQDVSTQAPHGTEEQLKPGPIQISVSNPTISQHDLSLVSIPSSDPGTCTLPQEKSQEKILPRPKDLLEAFERIYGQPSRSTRHKQPQPGMLFFSAGTHMHIAALDNVPWGFLFFQTPDNWIQTALIPRDYSRKAILLQPLAKAANNSPLRCDIKKDLSKRVAVERRKNRVRG
jgi:hypothetical protein